MAKQPRASAPPSAALDAARSAARNTDSGPAHPAPPAAGKGDIPAQKAIDTQALAASMPANLNKPLEHTPQAPVGQSAKPPSRLPTGSTPSESNASAKTGSVAPEGINATIGTLDRVRVDSGGQRLTTNQGVPIADNQNSLKAGARGPVLLEDFILREKITHFDHERIPERIVHARGSGAHGFFECYEPLTEYTRAAPFREAGKVTPVFVRFSTVAGERGSKDTARDVRGFAVKFYTDEGNWDLVGNNMPVFFIQDAMKFPDLVHAVKPEPHHAMPQAASAHDTFWDFVSLMPESTHMLMWQMSDRAIPRSYRMMQGFGVHTFRLVNEAGESVLVKFHWQPKLGTHSLVWDEAVKISGADPDYHRRDLWEAIDAGEYPEWELGLQIFTEEQAAQFSFDILDATKIVPEELVPIRIVGRMVLNRNPDNFFAETEQVAFCTAHVVPGIDFTNDPLLAGRIHSYVDTQITRLGGPNFHELPINAPIAPVHNNQRDGMHRQAIHRGRSAYEPNSLGGGCPFQAGAAQGFESVARRLDAKESSDKVRVKPEKFADHYTQATLFYESQTPEEQAHIAAAFRFELSKVTVPAVRERVVASLLNASPDLAAKVAKGLGMELPQPLPKVLETPAAPEVDQSPALSLMARPGDGGIRTRKIAILVADGAEGTSIGKLVTALVQAGAVPRLVGPRLGTYLGMGGEKIEADASMENSPGFLFDALVLPDGLAAVEALVSDGHSMEFVKDQYRHCKTILALGASQALLAEAGIPMSLPDGSHDPGLILADAAHADDAAIDFIAAVGMHRHLARDSDPPRV
ncbi:catalase [Variovorax boronicumulans]|uniref:Catalase n=1 Tax=Variovorax paradoxus (strain EPS) TaxID=595537 RepID=E6V705_VARPE|nr:MULTISPECIES: catalase [Variovorax]ADU37209.1 Catalase [Variovorax paradoxus EPS]MDP9991678.1 catalase [Variovorax boronicumulans]MDQ0003706.1 catalase [Variovorax boronicumulans]MDQ0040789.1 catalase [Variovorax boronicumulans]